MAVDQLSDERCFQSVHNIQAVLADHALFPCLISNILQIVATNSPLDSHGVDLFIEFDPDHPLTPIVSRGESSQTLFVQSKSSDKSAAEFVRTRIVIPDPRKMDFQAPKPMIVLNGQRQPEELVADAYIQLLLAVGLLHDGQSFRWPSPWDSQIHSTLHTCDHPVPDIVLRQLNTEGISHRNSGYKSRNCPLPYFFELRDKTLSTLASLKPLQIRA